MAERYEWDEEKSQQNFRKHGLSFDAADQFNWGSAQIFTDDRKDYGEDRFQARGLIDDRLHILVFTLRGEAMRIISLRKANLRERRAYVRETGRQL